MKAKMAIMQYRNKDLNSKGMAAIAKQIGTVEFKTGFLFFPAKVTVQIGGIKMSRTVYKMKAAEGLFSGGLTYFTDLPNLAYVGKNKMEQNGAEISNFEQKVGFIIQIIAVPGMTPTIKKIQFGQAFPYAAFNVEPRSIRAEPLPAATSSYEIESPIGPGQNYSAPNPWNTDEKHASKALIPNMDRTEL